MINLRVEDEQRCFYSNGITSVVRNGSAVTVTIWTTDAIPPGGCPAELVTPRLMPMGNFGAGNYEVEVIVCVNAPIPCDTEATLSLSVFGSNGQRFTVPAASWSALFLLAMALGVAGIRPRSR